MGKSISRQARAGRGARLTPVRRFLADAGGATALEYGLIAGLIFAVMAGSLHLYGTGMNRMYVRIGTTVSQVN